MHLVLLLSSLVSNPDDLGLPHVSPEGAVTSVLNIVFLAAGLVSTIFVIVGGIKYTLSGGDSAGIKSAKETITYAIVGLVITLAAFGIVKFVTGLK